MPETPTREADVDTYVAVLEDVVHDLQLRLARLEAVCRTFEQALSDSPEPDDRAG